MLGMADAPEAREEAVALWAWLRIEWALGLIEAWTITDRTEVSAGRLVSPLEDPLKSLHDLVVGPFVAASIACIMQDAGLLRHQGRLDFLRFRNYAGCWARQCLNGGHADVQAVQRYTSSRPA